MKITAQQVQAVKDAYTNADAVLQIMYKNATEKIPTQEDYYSKIYQEGRRNALRDIIDELNLLS